MTLLAKINLRPLFFLQKAQHSHSFPPSFTRYIHHRYNAVVYARLAFSRKGFVLFTYHPIRSS